MNSMLREYLKRRNIDNAPQLSTAEQRANREPLRFVVQKHAAHHLHYDLRLELGGVLKSWAVPRGPSSDPRERRLAFSVENRPLDYAEFEGVIPRGEYGAGEVIVWDAGVYSPDDDSAFFFGDRWEAEERLRRGLAQGKLSLFFWGYKLAGSWTLVKRQGSEREWLFVKQGDLFAEPQRDLVAEGRSVLSSRTIEDLREEAAGAQKLRQHA